MPKFRGPVHRQRVLDPATEQGAGRTADQRPSTHGRLSFAECYADSQLRVASLITRVLYELAAAASAKATLNSYATWQVQCLAGSGDLVFHFPAAVDDRRSGQEEEDLL